MSLNLPSLFKKEYRWHFVFWLFILLEAPVGAAIQNDSFLFAFVFRAVGLVAKMASAYTLAYYLFPTFFLQRKYLRFCLGFAVMIIAAVYLARILNVHLAERIMGVGQPYESIPQMIAQFNFTFHTYFGRVFSVTFWFLLIKFGVDQLNNAQKIASLSQEKAEAELNFLKAQIHPHFLFNTLNNLYTLTLEKSDEAPEVVIKLSAMLDYLLYQCSAPQVPVQKEIELINNYIGLESLRYGERLDLQFEHNLENPNATIAPLLLLSPVENAFKHGTSGTMGQTVIKIKLEVQAGQLLFRVQNTKPPTPPTDEQNYTAGIGLKNVRSQLDLTYPKRYTLDIQEEANMYTVDLSIQLWNPQLALS